MFKIAEKQIGATAPPFLIAEAGINHNGDIKKAFEMIEVAKAAGVNAVKFQTFKASEFITDPDLDYTYTSQGAETTESMLRMFERVQFSEEEWFRIRKHCDDSNIMFMSTPQNVSDLELLLKIGMPAIKVGSDDFTNIPLLKRYSEEGLPLLLSTGMADFGEVYEALTTIGADRGHPTVLFLCTSQYPTPACDVNIEKLETFANAFPYVVLGFSDHTQGPLASSLAVAKGARVFEKHFTLDHNLPGPDHWFSDDPDELKIWVDSINTAYTMLGSSEIKPTAEEEKMRVLARRSIVAVEAIPAGQVLTSNNIGLRRPGNGLAPSLFSKMLGLKASQDIDKGALLDWGDFTR